MRGKGQVALVVALIVVAFGVIVAALSIWPQLAVPIESAAVVLGTGFTAYAAYAAWKAAQVSRSTTRDALERELRVLQAERLRLDADMKRDEQFHRVASSYEPGGARETALSANLAEYSVRATDVDARIAEIREELS